MGIWLENLRWSGLDFCAWDMNGVFGIGESIQVTLATQVIDWTRLFDISSVSICLSVMHTSQPVQRIQ